MSDRDGGGIYNIYKRTGQRVLYVRIRTAAISVDFRERLTERIFITDVLCHKLTVRSGRDECLFVSPKINMLLAVSEIKKKNPKSPPSNRNVCTKNTFCKLENITWLLRFGTFSVVVSSDGTERVLTKHGTVVSFLKNSSAVFFLGN